MQQTFLQLYKHWRRLDTSRMDAYARRVLVNGFLSHRRKFRREHVMPEPPDSAVAGADTAISHCLRAALHRLPPKQRALVVLRHLEDVSVAEAAEMLGITEGTVKSQTARGLEKLRAEFAGDKTWMTTN